MLKITPSNNINFGYNKAYHQEVKQTLQNSKAYPSQAKYLMQLEKMALDIEDELILMESKRRTKSLKYSNLSDMLIDIKKTMGFYMEFIFPGLKFVDSEIVQYLSEAKTAKSDDAINWRKRLCEDISEFSTNQYPELDKKDDDKKADDKKDEIFVPAFDKFGREIPPKSPSAKVQNIVNEIVKQATSGDEDDISLLEKFEPTKHSPKGFCDVEGMDELKKRFQEDIIEYVIHPELLEQDEKEYGINLPKGYILYGPPGCGKTMIVEALAQESGLDMYKMDISKIGSKYVNQTSNNLQKAFDALKKIAQKSNKPIILFMDEIDSIAQNRDIADDTGETQKAVATLLKLAQQMREYNVIIFGATNRINSLDWAFCERLGEETYVGLPDFNQRVALIKFLLAKIEKGEDLLNNEQEIEKIAREFEGFSNRTITNIIDRARKLAKNDNRAYINSKHIINAIGLIEAEKINEDNYKKIKSKTSSIGFKA